MIKRPKILAAFLAVTLISTFTAVPVNAAKYTKSESMQVQTYQQAFRKLDKTSYDQTSLFKSLPVLSAPFQAGELQPAYIQTSMDYINYYRSLFNLPAENNYPQDNINAQIGASTLAALNAQTSLQAHGLLGYKRPAYISKQNWNTAELATLGNINFLEDSTNQPGQIVTDLLQDQNNLSGSGNTGHRALLLSARATKMGIGAAYGKDNHKFYSVENGMFASDILRQPVQNTVTYPSKQLFPYELVQNDTPWSAYFAQIRIKKTPKVYITDLTLKKKPKYRAVHVRNFGTDYFSDGYSAAISFKPNSKTKLINTHKYRVQIGNIYSYSFKFFRENK